MLHYHPGFCEFPPVAPPAKLTNISFQNTLELLGKASPGARRLIDQGLELLELEFALDPNTLPIQARFELGLFLDLALRLKPACLLQHPLKRACFKVADESEVVRVTWVRRDFAVRGEYRETLELLFPEVLFIWDEKLEGAS